MFKQNHTEHYVEICRTLGYQFKEKKWLLQALTRRSALIEERQIAAVGDFQRLEFLGDKVLALVISEILFEQHPDCQEGQLTQMTAKYVNNQGPLAMVAHNLELSQYLILGRGEELQDIHKNTKVLSDAVEALFGAVFLDCGKDYQVVRQLVQKHWAPLGLCQAMAKNIETAAPNFSSRNKLEDSLDKELIEAILAVNEKEVASLLEKGANPNTIHTCRDEAEEDELPPLFESYTRSALQLAVTQSSIAMVKALIEFGADPNWQGSSFVIETNPLPAVCTFTDFFNHRSHTKTINDKETVLHMIAGFEEISEIERKIVAFLLEKGANPLLTDYKGRTAFAIAKSQRFPNKELLKLLHSSNFTPSVARLTAKSFEQNVFRSVTSTLRLALPELTEDDLFNQVNTLGFH